LLHRLLARHRLLRLRPFGRAFPPAAASSRPLSRSLLRRLDLERLHQVAHRIQHAVAGRKLDEQCVHVRAARSEYSFSLSSKSSRVRWPIANCFE
jgi:hypothetical protein